MQPFRPSILPIYFPMSSCFPDLHLSIRTIKQFSFSIITLWKKIITGKYYCFRVNFLASTSKIFWSVPWASWTIFLSVFDAFQTSSAAWHLRKRYKMFIYLYLLLPKLDKLQCKAFNRTSGFKSGQNLYIRSPSYFLDTNNNSLKFIGLK